MTLIQRLRDGVVKRQDWHGSVDEDVTNYTMDEAADLLEFFFSQMQVYSAKMDGQHHYRFRGGWPMNHAIGNTPEEAALAALQESRKP